MSKMTMWQQYLSIKQKYADVILFFRLGDFYETFGDDAKLIAEVLDITLTVRGLSSDENTPMAGVPYHAADNYIEQLVSRGYRVAICEQMDEMVHKTLQKREVVRIVTPGTLTEPTMLQAERNSYLAAILVDRGNVGLAYADLTTGEFCATELRGNEALKQLEGELARLGAAELLVSDAPELRPAGMEIAKKQLAQDLAPMRKAERERLLPHERTAKKVEGNNESTWVQGNVTQWPNWHWDARTARDALLNQFKSQSLDGFGLGNKALATRAAGALIQYLHETQRDSVAQVRSLRVYDTTRFMFLDPQTRRNLELTEGAGGQRKGSLIAVLDQTRTPMGARLLRQWISQPLIELGPLTERQQAVSCFVEETLVRGELRALFKGVGDIERTINRVVQGIATPRDLVRLREALRLTPDILSQIERTGLRSTSPTEAAPSDDDLFDDEPTSNQIDACADICELLEQAIADDPPALLGTWDNARSDENVIRKGHAAEIDAIVEATRDAARWINELEAKEQQRTGIKTLKVSYNKVFGYYIEVTKASGETRIPDDYIRKQTLVNAERYITPELKEYESLILNASEALNEKERQAFRLILRHLANAGNRLLDLARAIAEFDVYSTLAEVAVRQRFVRPTLRLDDVFVIQGGRHPVVEHNLNEPFTPNDAHFDADHQIIVLTGPNMSGKSTFLRQVALIGLMAQIGSFVPADYAEIGLLDRIFTRIGAQDDIATGQSTFMVEMIETANILHNGSPRSLIILDEIGRGTSTYDGLSIARAVVEYIHNQPRLRAKTLFATHYHELTELANILPRVHNWTLAVAEEGDHVVFLRKVIEGAADRSYGIHVAQMAGLPPAVIKRATEVLSELEGKGDREQRREAMRRMNAAGSSAVPQMSLFASNEPNPAVELLREMDVTQLTPIEALTKLYELQRLAKVE
ncbi:MAG TPA: DNA mismatch repair protein MutS [Herpetosiphon sp.]|uniref:DNA mismatch repair protein MutS n=1 Tax=Herpetosiphon aurantiacus (strain ATCC 23779 / DSM 785 / 114-95) TaxID=316274 RepID=A9AWF1_HERA2|nr:DNA mismatch repair protein MutS [Herpetosiphon sp.]ABX06710.1 DNA mismatch repair protein MutS [Herpetosiphon aurantiacus DSM 785]HBW52212.1 DNA mismatch repair protein MutS [Herpetosiphon sp.]